MRTNRIIFARVAILLLMVLTTAGAWAEDSKIIVWLKNGSTTEVLFDDMPEFAYDKGTVTLKSSTTELSWPLEQLQKFTFDASESVITDIKVLPIAGKLDLAKGCAVYDLNGKLVKERINSLSELSPGVYIVDDGSVTTKVIRK